MIYCLAAHKEYSSKTKIKDTLFNLKSAHDKLTIVTPGLYKYDLNKYIRQTTVLFEINLIEFNPSYSVYTPYSWQPESKYGKTYHISQVGNASKHMARSCGAAILFGNRNHKVSDMHFDMIVKYLEKFSKKIHFISE